MKTIRCNRCKQMFEFEGLPPECCPSCKEKENERHQIVRDFIKQFPGVNALEIAKHTKVPVSVIMNYIKSGDLHLTAAKEK